MMTWLVFPLALRTLMIWSFGPVDWSCFHRRFLIAAWQRQRECGAIPSMKVIERELEKHQTKGCPRCYLPLGERIV